MANGCAVLNVIVAVQLYTPPGMISTATRLLVATRSLGGAVGMTLNGTILANALGVAQLPAKFAAAVLPLGFPAAQLGALIGAFASGHPETLSQLPWGHSRGPCCRRHGVQGCVCCRFQGCLASCSRLLRLDYDT